MEKQIIEIIKERDEYPYSLEISTNAKGEAQFSAKFRFDVGYNPEKVKDKFIDLLKQMKRSALARGTAYNKEQIELEITVLEDLLGLKKK